MSDARDADVSVHFAAAPGYATHEVLNQAGALADYNAYTDDKPLVDAVRVFGADWADAIPSSGRDACRQREGAVSRAASKSPSTRASNP